MFLDEVCNVVNNARYRNKTTTVLALIKVVVPFHDRQTVQWDTPVKSTAFYVQALLCLLQAALLNFIGAEFFQVMSESNLLAGPNEPLGRVILMPLDSISVVAGKLVVKIVVALAKCYECGEYI